MATKKDSKLSLSGISVAGVETSIEVPPLDLVLDMGRCTPTAVRYRYVLVSHGHLDHAGALPLHAARRALMKMPEAVYVVPKRIAPDIERLFEAAGALDGHAIPRRIIALDPGEELALSRTRRVRAFATFHRVPSQGYTVLEERHRLRAEFRGKPGNELARARASGVEVDETYRATLLAFSGDTRIDVLEAEPSLSEAETLILETSFLDARVSVAEARAMGHVHLDEVVARKALLPNPDLVFCHFSARYAAREIRELVSRLPDELRERVRAFGSE